MDLIKHKIQNYQCIDDSDWIDIEDVTALVGKNETGKTALLTAQYKLNPATQANYDGMYEFPRSKFTDEFTNDDWIVSEKYYYMVDWYSNRYNTN